MDHCTQCGAEPGIGRFCTTCGHPVPDGGPDAWRTDTAERPRAAVPAAVVPDEPTRFPLFADEADPTGDLPAYAADDEPDDPGGGAWVPWVVGFAVMLLVAGLGIWLLTGDDDPGTSAGDLSATGRPTRDRDPEPTPTETETETETEPETTPEPEPNVPADLARFAAVEAPPPAAPSQDNSGNSVRYVATNMVDGVPETTWRTVGDATGETITFTFDEPTTLREIGLINGYAKVGQDSGGVLDWYHGNRRVLQVQWVLDDGTTVTQDLDDTTIVQTVALKRVTTRTVQLRLLEVSPPGPGRASRDYTAISDIRLYGTTG